MIYQIESYQLHVNTSKVLCEDKEQPISPKTLKLLIHLLERPNEIISKQQLLDAIWGSTGAKEYLLFQSIKEIRALFFSDIVIKTHPNKGYQWVAKSFLISADQNKRQHQNHNLNGLNKRSVSIVISMSLLILMSIIFTYAFQSH